MMLHTLRYGTPTELPSLLIVHGLFGSGRNWGAIAKRMAQEREVVCVDMRNHADSPWTDTHSYPDLAQDLAKVIDQHGTAMDVLGHSMGGKAAMVLALTRPELVNRLLVADIAPVSYSHSQTPLIHALYRLDLASVTSRQDANAALSTDIPDPATRAFLLQSLDLRAQPARWRLNLAVLEREMDTITGWPDDITGQSDAATLFLGGAQSDYVRTEHRPIIKALFPQAKFAKLPDAGHWLHADAPQAFIDTARIWFGPVTARSTAVQ